MSIVTLHCPSVPELKLGPGTPSSWPGEPAHMSAAGLIPETPGHEAGANLIVFARGFAEVDTEKLPDWRTWVDSTKGDPAIEIIEDESIGLSGEGHICEWDGLPFKTDLGLQSHRRAHIRRGEQVPVPVE